MTNRSSRDWKNVIRLGWVSFLNDVGSEALTRLVPLYVSGVLGASMVTVGLIEGVAEATATVFKPLFGALSDKLGSRKSFVFWGYGLSALSRPFLGIAGSAYEIGFLRFFDRVGKGVRTAPRDALIADSGTPAQHGRNFGINRVLDTLGALLSVLAVAAWVWRRGEGALNVSNWLVIALACSVPGVAVLALIVLGIHEPERLRAKAFTPLHGRLSGTLKRYFTVVALFSLANSSDAFIVLRARELGYSLAATLGIIALLNVVSTLTILPASILSDRLGRRNLIALGWTVFAAAYAAMGLVRSWEQPWVFVVIVAAYGLFYGFTDSVERAWIADLAPEAGRGRAYGVFGFVVGATTLPSSVVFGWLWDQWGSQVAFLFSSTIALFSIALLFALVPAHSRKAAK